MVFISHSPSIEPCPPTPILNAAHDLLLTTPSALCEMPNGLPPIYASTSGVTIEFPDFEADAFVPMSRPHIHVYSCSNQPYVRVFRRVVATGARYETIRSHPHPRYHLALTACGRSLNSEVNLSTDPITFRFASNVDKDVLLSFAVSGPFSDCKPDSDTPILEPVVWGISDELGLPDTITYGEIPPEALNDVPAQAPAVWRLL